MMEYSPYGAKTDHAAFKAPTDFMRLSESLPAWLDHKLGYFGEDRFVSFSYEPRADGVMWTDSHSYGFGSGAWLPFMDQIAPLMDLYEVNLGSSESEGSHVLLIDRLRRQAYFVERGSAEGLLSHQGGLLR